MIPYEVCTILITLSLIPNVNCSPHVNEPRTLVVANGGIIKLIVGVTMPVELPVSLIWLQNLQFQYPMIDNASQLSYLNLNRKSSRTMTRNTAYTMLAETWNRFGMNGTSCVLRLICHTSRYSIEHNGILGQLLHTVFKPHRSSSKIYVDAMKSGNRGGKCDEIYQSCPNNVFDQFI